MKSREIFNLSVFLLALTLALMGCDVHDPDPDGSSLPGTAAVTFSDQAERLRSFPKSLVSEDLYAVAELPNHGLIYSMAEAGDSVFYAYYMNKQDPETKYGYFLSKISAPQTGEVTIQVDGALEALLTFEDRLFAFVKGTDAVRCLEYDGELNLQNEREIFSGQANEVRAAGKKAFWRADDSLYVYDLLDGGCKRIPLFDICGERAADYSISRAEGERALLVAGEDQECFWVSADGSAEGFYTIREKDWWLRRGLAYSASGKHVVRVCEEEPVFSITAPMHEEEELLSASGSYTLTSRYIPGDDAEEGSFAYSCYDAQNSRCYEGLSLPDRYRAIYSKPLSSGCAVILLSDYSSVTQLCLWDFSAAQSRPADITVCKETEAAPLLQEKAEKIEQTYSVQLSYDWNKLEAGTYTAAPVRNAGEVWLSLDTIEETLAKFPPGMIEEMTNGNGPLGIYPCSYLGSSDPRSPRRALGTMDSIDSRPVVAAVCGYEDNLAHELMHVMEARIATYSIVEDDDFHTRWFACAPKGFSYWNAYVDADGYDLNDPEYTVQASGVAADYGDVWFVDAYSKTNAQEDRAMIFEMLFTKEPLPAYFSGRHMREKTTMLCEALQKSFPSCAGEDTLWWERSLDNFDI